MPNLAIQPATAPVDAPFPPASAQAMLNFVAAYLGVSGLENLQGFIKSSASPAAEDQDRAWLRLDPSSGRPLGIYVFNGQWTAVPLVVQTGENTPTAPKKGELFYDTKGGVQVYNGSAWTTNLTPTGTTADRPEAPAIYSLYYDTDISRLLRYTSQGWSTADGAIGDIKMVDADDEDEALSRNPGWVVYSAIAGRFPIGASDTYAAQTAGGSGVVAWSAKGRSGQGGAREATASFMAQISIDGTEVVADGKKMDSLTDIGSGSFKTVPPYRAFIFLRKDY